MDTDSLKFHLGQRVFLMVNPDLEGMVTGIVFRPNGFAYYVTFADGGERTHYEMELTSERTYHAE